MAHTVRIALTVLTFAVTDISHVAPDASQSGPSNSSAAVTLVRTRTMPITHTASHDEDRLDLERETDHPSLSGVAALTDEQRELVAWAKNRFTQAGLELPELTVRFDPTRELCGHNDGRYQHMPNGERMVTICTRHGDSFGADLERRRTLVHEFGHAWDFANLSDGDRGELSHQLGVESWSDHEDAWDDRGVERFAETFVFALLDQPRRQLKVSLECIDLVSTFRTATGGDVLGPGLPQCAS